MVSVPYLKPTYYLCRCLLNLYNDNRPLKITVCIQIYRSYGEEIDFANKMLLCRFNIALFIRLLSNLQRTIREKKDTNRCSRLRDIVFFMHLPSLSNPSANIIHNTTQPLTGKLEIRVCYASSG